MRKNTFYILSFLLAVTCLAAEPTGEKTRPEHWAKPIVKDGVPNLHQVSPDLYRSAQPSAEGMKQMKLLGVRTVVNLRSFHSDRDELKGTKLGYEHITMKAWHAEEKEVIRFLKIVTDKKRVPVLVHCKHGADRTGTMCAIYRIVVCGWSKKEAIKEMRDGGFNFHKVFDNLIKYIEGLDIKDIRKKSGIPKPLYPRDAKIKE